MTAVEFVILQKNEAVNLNNKKNQENERHNLINFVPLQLYHILIEPCVDFYSLII